MKTKPSAVYWAAGRALPGQLVLADTLDDLLTAIIGPEYEPGLPAAVARDQRESWLVMMADEMQEALIRGALASGTFSWASCSDGERTRLNRTKGTGQDHGEPWEGRVPLIIVNASRGRAQMPRSGAVLHFDPSTPASFLASCLRAGWIESRGTLTDPAKVADPLAQ